MSGIKTKYPHFLSQNILECKYEFYIQINLNLTLNIYTWFGGFRVLLTSSRWSFFIFLHNVSQVAYHWPRIPNIIFSTDVLGRVLAACWEGGSRRLGVLRPVPWTDVTRLLFLAVHAYADDMQPVPSQSSHMVNYYATSVRFLDPKI